ncbi:MAG TPA: hypothetical protein VF690_17550, partial [Hymenobacter sp.]
MVTVSNTMRVFLASALLFLISCKPAEVASALSEPMAKSNSYEPSNTFRVSKIDSINSVYLIYARRNDYLFKIISDKALMAKCNRIQVGRYYKFKLRSLLFTDLTAEE